MRGNHLQQKVCALRHPVGDADLPCESPCLVWLKLEALGITRSCACTHQCVQSDHELRVGNHEVGLSRLNPGSHLKSLHTTGHKEQPNNAPAHLLLYKSHQQ